jgi:UDPglucose 6-dehydrogenase
MSGLEHGVDLEIMTAAQEVNSSMSGYIVEKLRDALDGNLAGKKVAVLGLAFKAGTSDVRRSPGVLMANVLNKSGAITSAYDPQAAEEAVEELRGSVTLATSLENAIKDAEAVIIATDWPEFIGHDLTDYKARMSGTVFMDAVNGFVIPHVKAAGLHYIGVGR